MMEGILFDGRDVDDGRDFVDDGRDSVDDGREFSDA